MPNTTIRFRAELNPLEQEKMNLIVEVTLGTIAVFLVLYKLEEKLGLLIQTIVTLAAITLVTCGILALCWWIGLLTKLQPETSTYTGIVEISLLVFFLIDYGSTLAGRLSRRLHIENSKAEVLVMWIFAVVVALGISIATIFAWTPEAEQPWAYLTLLPACFVCGWQGTRILKHVRRR